MLAILDEIERKTGMIHDVRDRDDVYAFHSSFLLEVIRGRLGILGTRSAAADVPQIVREYHARLAAALEAALKTSAGRLDEVANHFYAAGVRYAAKGVEYCLRAADAAAAGYDFRRAKNYLDMADECAEFSRGRPGGRNERQVILCQEAAGDVPGPTTDAGGGGRVGRTWPNTRTPRPGWSWRWPNCVTRWGTAATTGNGCEAAIRLCRQVVAHPASAQEEAQARHIMAISQPRDRRAERIAELRRSLWASGRRGGRRSRGVAMVGAES